MTKLLTDVFLDHVVKLILNFGIKSASVSSQSSNPVQLGWHRPKGSSVLCWNYWVDFWLHLQTFDHVCLLALAEGKSLTTWSPSLDSSGAADSPSQARLCAAPDRSLEWARGSGKTQWLWWQWVTETGPDSQTDPLLFPWVSDSQKKLKHSQTLETLFNVKKEWKRSNSLWKSNNVQWLMLKRSKSAPLEIVWTEANRKCLLR